MPFQSKSMMVFMYFLSDSVISPLKSSCTPVYKMHCDLRSKYSLYYVTDLQYEGNGYFKGYF